MPCVFACVAISLSEWVYVRCCWQGVPRAIFPQIICRLRVRKFLFASRLACERNFFGSFFDLRSGILIFPHMYPTIKIYQQVNMFTERSKIKEISALLQLAVHIYH